MNETSEVTFRRMLPEDISAALSICRQVGWNQLAADWELFLKLSPSDCRVGVDSAGKIVGTVTTIRYQDHFCWIGMLLVDPALQRRGIGKNLLEQSLQILSHEQTVKLDATPTGREVYLKFGFIDEYNIKRMMIDDVHPDLNSPQTRPFQEQDFAEILKLDEQVFGADRKLVLDSLRLRNEKFSYVAEQGGKIVGYCFGREGYLYNQIGPVVAETFEIAKSLVSTAVANSTGKPLILDVPNSKSDWTGWLASIGFSEKRSLIRMYRGKNAWPGQPGKQFAILGPEFG